MNNFKYSFIGRERGAIGTAHSIVGTVEAHGKTMAELTVRNEYEIFHSLKIEQDVDEALAQFDTLPKSMTAYLPNDVAQDGSPAKCASDLGHIWVRGKRGNSYRHVFDSDLNHLFSGPNDDLRNFYECSPKTKYEA